MQMEKLKNSIRTTHINMNKNISLGEDINMRSIIGLSTILSFYILLTSCSVGMAVSGKENQNTSILFPGVPRTAVISRLGPPETSTLDEEGNYIESYLFVKGNEPSAGRAIGHGVMDVLTLGLWEIIGTPIELAAGSESYTRVIIYYDSNEKIKETQLVDVEKGIASTSQNEGNKTGGMINQGN